MQERIRLAVAGVGAFGREHLARLAAMPEVEIAGVADVKLADARQAAEQFGAKQTHAGVAELLAGSRPDGLIIATSGKTHVPVALLALELGIPVLVEKPVGLNAAEAGKLVAAEAASAGFVMPGHILRFSDHHRMLRDIARSPEVGPILAFTSRRHRDDTHVTRYADVDPVLMTMVHDIDLALWMTGASVAEVYALRRPVGARRSGTVMLATGKQGATWQLSTAWTYPSLETPPDRVEIVGENGGVELEAGLYIRQFGAKARHIDLRAEPPEDPLAAELRYFIQCIRSGERPKAVTLHDACEGLAAAEAVLASLQSGSVVRTR